MLTCQNCGHRNLEGALECAACYTALAPGQTCPSCTAQVSANALFCPQCGTALPSSSQEAKIPGNKSPDSTPQATEVVTPPKPVPPTDVIFAEIPEVLPLDDIPPLPDPPPLPSLTSEPTEWVAPPVATEGVPAFAKPQEIPAAGGSVEVPAAAVTPEDQTPQPAKDSQPEGLPASPRPPRETILQGPHPGRVNAEAGRTLLQQVPARLQHTHTGIWLDLPTHLSAIHIGKPNALTPPALDLSGFAHSEVVSRVHAVINVQPDGLYLEDLGSSNGTYINGMPLPAGDRYRLRSGDRIAFGKEDKVSFVFQTT